MNSTAACLGGWSKDPMHTAADRCPVPTRLLEDVCTACAVVGGTCSLCVFATVVLVVRHGGGDRKLVATYASIMLGTVAFSASMSLLSAGAEGGLADPGAPWRALSFASVMLMWVLPISAGHYQGIMANAAKFGGGIDMVRLRALTLVVNIGHAGMVLCLWGAVVPGKAMSILSTSGSTQDAGAVLMMCGYAGTLVSCATPFLFLGHQLAGLERELGVASSSGKQVAGLRKALQRGGAVLLLLVPVYVTTVAAPALRNVAGVIVFVIYVVVVTVATVIISFVERSRLAPSRAAAQAKVHPTAAAVQCSGHRTVAAFAANAHRELAQDAARRELLLGQERRPSGVPLNGVSLQLLRDFAREFGIDDETTARDVCARHVKPTTQGTRSALVTVLQGARDGAGALWCDKPTHFISYAWTYPFRLIIDILECFEEEQPPPAGTANFYFLDQFSLNQHTLVTEDANQTEMQERVVAALEGQMLKAGHVLMCLHPWDRPVPLSRAWCLFELYVALESKCKLSMCFGREDTGALFAAVKDRNFTAADAVGEIDAANADASVASDKALIIGLIENTMGIQRFNATMQAALLKCFKASVTGVLARAYSTPSRSRASCEN
jgi:hypothetical protein